MKSIYHKHSTISLLPATEEDFQDLSDEFIPDRSFVAWMGEQPLGVIAGDRVFVFPEFANFGVESLLYGLINSK